MEIDKIYNMDCLEGMKQIPDGSIDAIICDLPYGTTACAWDVVIPFDKLWEQYNRILKPQGVVALFGSEPFSTNVRMSNFKHYKYDWYWVKTKANGFQHAKNRPMMGVETISIFSNASMGHVSILGDRRMTYNPQGVQANGTNKITQSNHGRTMGARPHQVGKVYEAFTNFPSNVLYFDNIFGTEAEHPTQKPVDLLRYLIRTYSNEGDTILDNCMGSGTTAVACIKEKRHFIGFELNKEYYDKACQRIDAEQRQLTLF